MSTNRLALGTVQFGLDYGVANEAGQVAFEEVHHVMDLAKANEIDVLDTAIAYGTSEEVLGKVGVDGFRVVTKLPPLAENQNNVAQWVTKQVRESLARLGQKKVYGLLLHRSEDLSASQSRQLIQALADLKDVGIVQKIGVSIYSPDQLKLINNKIKIDLVQAPLNVVDRRLQASGWLDRLKNDGVEVHTRSAFLQGLLLMNRNEIPKKFSRWASLWNMWHQNLRESEVSPIEACLAYPLSLEQVDQVIVGVDSTKQLQAILSSVSSLGHALDTSFMVSNDENLINPYNWGNL